MEIDHYDPELLDPQRNEYRNLYLATRHCNGSKTALFIKTDSQGRTLQILDPCNEHDYDHVLFEDPDTHELVGTTPRAEWHIIVCDLNADHLVQERKDRAEMRKLVTATPVIVKKEMIRHTRSGVVAILSKLDRMIPPISAPPKKK
ncbi:MAG: hypothetical protein WCO94_11890 [Verrucomicrobiota bacterium]